MLSFRDLGGSDVNAKEIDAYLREDVADEGIADSRNIPLLVRIDPKHVRTPESEQVVTRCDDNRYKGQQL